MGKASDELRLTLQRLEQDLQRLRTQRVQKGAGRTPAGPHATATPAVPPPKPSNAAAFGHYAALIAVAGLGAAGIEQNNRILMTGAFLGIIGFLAWISRSAAQSHLAPVGGDVGRRVASLERRVAGLGMGAGAPGANAEIEEQLQELRTIIKALMSALEDPAQPGAGGGQENLG